MTYNIGKVIKGLRERENLSIIELSKKTGIAKSSLYHIEAGTKNASFKTLQTLSVILNEPLPLMIMTAFAESKEADDIKELLEKYYSKEKKGIHY
ncbi:helix-turn-helix transcriptional regulator [uncultured Algibacter sp.]|uniref:helix-turn-helix domain-containing protein n=1 Tax=uncultured Algibacter sp. TaxID=298659 RepID=UPI0026049C4B|nr:helix-turn-helix transcriptional regulator [uncultured Algibacter sp.]